MKLRVLGKDYRVDHVKPDTFEGRYGDCDTDKLRIRVCDDLHPDQYADTMLHEVLHAVWSAQELPEDHELEERIVSLMSKGLLCMLRENGERLPKFMRKPA